MLKLFTLFLTITALYTSSYDIEDCETWYNQAQRSLTTYAPVYKHYHVSRCFDQTNQGVKIVLNGEYSNRICYVVVNEGSFVVNNRDPMDCFRYFDMEMPRAKKRANHLL